VAEIWNWKQMGAVEDEYRQVAKRVQEEGRKN
jgi:hypothetical protein